MAQTYYRGANLPTEWWNLFHSKTINQLVEQGLANSPTIAIAEGNLRQAQEQVYAQIGSSLLPNVTTQLGGQRQRTTGASQGAISSAIGSEATSGIFNLYNASVNVSYTLDVFGGARRQIEQLQAQVNYQQYQLIAAYLTLTSNIVTTAITAASLQSQINTTRNLLNAEVAQLNIIKQQYRVGGVAALNVLSQETTVQQTRALIPPLQKSLSQSLHQLSVLVGAFPNGKIPVVDLDQIILPKNIPVTLPSELVRQRPDILASEALLHAACAQVGVATANLYPQFTLSAAYGWQSAIPSMLFEALNHVWSYGGQATQSVFSGGSLQAQRRAAIDAFQVAGAQYKQVVLQAFQNVADSLRAIETDARTFKAQKQAEIAAHNTLRVTQQQYNVGGVSYLSLQTAQQQYLQAVINRIQAQATRYTDTVALFQSLGGGWWNDPANFSETRLQFNELVKRGSA